LVYFFALFNLSRKIIFLLHVVLRVKNIQSKKAYYLRKKLQIQKNPQKYFFPHYLGADFWKWQTMNPEGYKNDPICNGS
jgi:hypothetical protein